MTESRHYIRSIEIENTQDRYNHVPVSYGRNGMMGITMQRRREPLRLTLEIEVTMDDLDEMNRYTRGYLYHAIGQSQQRFGNRPVELPPEFTVEDLFGLSYEAAYRDGYSDAMNDAEELDSQGV